MQNVLLGLKSRTLCDFDKKITVTDLGNHSHRFVHENFLFGGLKSRSLCDFEKKSQSLNSEIIVTDFFIKISLSRDWNHCHLSTVCYKPWTSEVTDFPRATLTRVTEMLRGWYGYASGEDFEKFPFWIKITVTVWLWQISQSLTSEVTTADLAMCVSSLVAIWARAHSCSTLYFARSKSAES